MGIQRIGQAEDDVTEVRIVEFIAAYAAFRQRMIEGLVDSGSLEFAEFFDKYDTLLEKFEELQDAYLVVSGIKDPGNYLLRFHPGMIEVIQYAPENDH